jgi:hypothetical protein
LKNSLNNNGKEVKNNLNFRKLFDASIKYNDLHNWSCIVNPKIFSVNFQMTLDLGKQQFNIEIFPKLKDVHADELLQNKHEFFILFIHLET